MSSSPNIYKQTERLEHHTQAEGVKTRQDSVSSAVLADGYRNTFVVVKPAFETRELNSHCYVVELGED